MWAKIRGASTTLAKLATESDRAKLRSLFAIFSLRRRLVAGVSAALGIFVLVGMSHGLESEKVRTLVATNEIASGAVIANKDVALRELPIHLVADGSFHALNDAVGQIAVGTIRRGETITDARVVGPSLLSENDLVAIAVTVREMANAQLVHAGDHVDVLASQNDSVGATSAAIIANDVEVLSTRTHESGGVVVLAVSINQAQSIAGVHDRITLVLRGN